jgi:hypothetical protein
VATRTAQGTYAQYRTVKAADCLVLPEGTSGSEDHRRQPRVVLGLGAAVAPIDTYGFAGFSYRSALERIKFDVSKRFTLGSAQSQVHSTSRWCANAEGARSNRSAGTEWVRSRGRENRGVVGERPTEAQYGDGRSHPGGAL